MTSFDIFDTVLTRTLGSPTSVFLLLGRILSDQGLIAVPAAEFARLRVQAEVLARQQCGWGEVTFDVIYEQFADLLPLQDDQREQIMQLECEIEGSLLRVVPGAIERVEQARQQFGRVLFVSDMYLPRSVILRWLEQHGLWQDGDRLYLSNEAKLSKASGRLFSWVLQQEGIPPDRLLHRGNHLHSDVSVPSRMGIRLQPFAEGNLNRFESIMESFAASTGGLSSALAGASRLARMSVVADDARERTLRDVGAGVMAPLLIAYVLWVLRRARARSLRRLYFVSRDGQILIEIARRLAPRRGLECEFRYLYASRQSWHLPGLTRIDAGKLEWICMKYDFLSLRSLLARVELTPEEVVQEIAPLCLSAKEWDRQLTSAEIATVKALLSKGPLYEFILQRASQKRELLLGYLQQEGLFEHDAWALVDVGWNGRLQASLVDVMAAVGRTVPGGFYFGLDSRPTVPDAGFFESFLYEPAQPRAQRPFAHVDVATLLEMACAADHGSVTRFERVGPELVPVLRERRNSAVIAWGLPVIQDAIRTYCEHLEVQPGIFADPETDLRPMLEDVVRAFWIHPTKTEAEVWGRFPFENDQSGTASHPIACPYDMGTVLRALLGQRMGSASVSFWQNGSIMISPPVVRLALQYGTRVKQFFRSRFRLASS